MSDFGIEPDVLEGISRVLGRELSASEKGLVPSFSDFLPADVDEFARLGRANGIYAISYIRFRIREGVGLGAVHSYFIDVVQGAKSVEDWIDASKRWRHWPTGDAAVRYG